MENSEYQINGSYRFSTRLKGEVELTLFNDFFLHVHRRDMKKEQDFKLELATISPDAEKVEDHTVHWLAAAVLAALATAYFLYSLITTTGENGIIITLLGIAIGLLMASGFTALYFYTTQRKWILKTRAASYPLIEMPYTKRGQKEAAAFLAQLQQAIENNVTKKRYSDDDLFAGEMRMLRRLANNHVLSMSLYDRAKAHMLKTHQAKAA